jgi:hypothetical protein
LSIDVVLLMMLVVTQPRPHGDGDGALDFFLALGRSTAASAIAVFAVVLAAQTRFVHADSSIQWSEGYEEVVLQPAAWEGRRCPVMSQIVAGEPLRLGNWTIVFVRDGCVHCRTLLEALDRRFACAGCLRWLTMSIAGDRRHDRPG